LLSLDVEAPHREQSACVTHCLPSAMAGGLAESVNKRSQHRSLCWLHPC
jgi:hypothetical protein